MNAAAAVGAWSAATVVVIGIAYAATLAVGMAQVGLDAPIGDPVLAVMECLTIASATSILVAIAAIYEMARPTRRLFGAVALAFAILFAGTTTTVHFVALTAARQLGQASFVWPSAAYAAELAAWDWFLGLALLAAAMVYGAEGSD